MAQYEFGFNTGRLYQEDGQRIEVHVEDLDVYFYDHSRGITGKLKIGWDTRDKVTPRVFMYYYDRNDYFDDPTPGRQGWSTVTEYPLVRITR